MKVPSPIILLVSFVFTCAHYNVGISQDPNRFNDEIAAFKQDDQDVNYNNLVVFTGSSSIRFWPSVQEEFAGVNVINRGFGGSLMSDLLYHIDQLILQYRPVKVFIYEGDNDVFSGKSNEEIVNDAKAIVQKIRDYTPDSKIIFISPKPSVARWDLKDQYIQLNYKLGLYAMIQPNVEFIDVWTPMCDENGVVMKDIFIQDNLHMNAKGYSIWKEVIEPYVRD